MRSFISWKEATVFWWSQSWRIMVAIVFLAIFRVPVAKVFSPAVISIFDLSAFFIGIGIQIWAIRCAMAVWVKSKGENRGALKT